MKARPAGEQDRRTREKEERSRNDKNSVRRPRGGREKDGQENEKGSRRGAAGDLDGRKEVAGGELYEEENRSGRRTRWEGEQVTEERGNECQKTISEGKEEQQEN